MITKKSGTSFFDIKKNATSSEFPQVFTDYIRSFGEVYLWEAGNFHVVTRAHHAREVLMSPDYTADRGSFFVSRMPNMDLSLISGFFGVVKKMMVMSDDEDHNRRRKAASAGFEDHILEKFSTKLKATVQELVIEMKGRTHFDFSEISRKLPSTVLAELLSIPQEDRAQFFQWSNIMTGFFGGASQYRNEDGIEVNSAALSLKKYFEDLVTQRSKNPGEDYVSMVLKMQKVFDLTLDEVTSQLIMMLVAGMATTTDQLNNCMFLLAERPELQKELRENPKLIAGALEEFKRIDPAVTFIFRVARNATKIGDQDIKPGDVIFISTHAINRDLPAETNPDEINIHRKAPHFAYGYGPHYCIGAKLGRVEMQHLMEMMIKELPILVLDDKESARDHYSLSFSGFKNLYLKTL